MHQSFSLSLTTASENRSYHWLVPVLGSVFTLLVLGVATHWLIGPACPKRIVIATGSDVGAYYAFARKYQPLLEKEGIELEIRQTAGSVENAALLRDPESGVSVAIMQGGIGNQTPSSLEDAGIQSLGSLFLEPIWVFYRTETPVSRLSDLAGKRVSIGAEGSGTRAIALELLTDNGFSENPRPNSVEPAPPTFFPHGSKEAAAALKAGKVDAAFFVLAPTAPLIQELINDENIELLSFDRAVAYKRRHPYLTSVTLSEGLLDLQNNLPAEDVELLAPTAVLTAREDLHPALVPLLLRAISEVHAAGGVLEGPHEFPSENHVEFPLNAAAKSYLRTGPSFLYRHFPFSVAAWVDRVKLMILPLCTLLIPLIKAAPPLYRWRIRSKIYTWYRVLRQVDQARKRSEGPEIAATFIDQLKLVERELSEISVPLSYMEEFYNLRRHVAFVLEQLERQQHTREISEDQPENLPLKKAA